MNAPRPEKPADPDFAATCARLRPELYRFAYWLARDRHIAEDVVQETLLRAWRSRDSLAKAESARHWLFTIARREHARLYERKRLKTVPVDELVQLESPELAATERREVAEVRAAMFALADDYREPLVMQVLLGYTTGEIAAALGLTQGAVLTRLFRARHQLRERLGTAGFGAREVD